MTLPKFFSDLIYEKDPSARVESPHTRPTEPPRDRPSTFTPEPATEPASYPSALKPIFRPTPPPPAAPDPYFDQLYQGLAAKTNIQSLPDFAQLKTYLDAIPEVAGLDERNRWKIAVAQAKSHSQLDGDKLIQAAMDLEKVLDDERDTFTTLHSKEIENQITGRANQIADLDQQVKALQGRMAEESSKLASAKSKLYQVEQSFRAAYNRRKTELQQEIVQLRGNFS